MRDIIQETNMTKYLEQRVEDQELELKLLKAKDKLSSSDYMYNPSVNLMSEPDLDTTFSSPFDKTDIDKNSLDVIRFQPNLKIDPFYVPDVTIEIPSKLDSDFPEYPDIVGSWDGDKNPEDVIIMENDEAITTWGFISNLDKMDKEFLDWLKTNYKKFTNENNS